MIFEISANVCNGIVGDAYTCCTSSNPCGVHQGDCDSDSECEDGLACGRDNCQSPFPSDSDCCEQGNLTTSTRPQVRPSLFCLKKQICSYSKILIPLEIRNHTLSHLNGLTS